MLEKHMKESNDSKVYEISYVLVSSLPAEKVAAEASSLAAILSKNAAEVISDEAPSLIPLAYEMDKSSGGGVHQRFTEGYFGWIKFSAVPEAIEGIKKAFDQNPHMLRTLAVSTIRENTYLGKRAKPEGRMEERPIRTAVADAAPVASEAAPAPVMTADDIAKVDKSIDEMVKGA
jgi:ribosomal protein S6